VFGEGQDLSGAADSFAFDVLVEAVAVSQGKFELQGQGLRELLLGAEVGCARSSGRWAGASWPCH
jgi:hypothetical protein